jgi:hypothetical protein
MACSGMNCTYYTQLSLGLLCLCWGTELCALRFCKFLRHLRQFTSAVFLNLLRKVCDPAVEGGTGDWRQLRSEELQDICCSSDVIRATSSRRMICTGRKDGLSLRLLTLGVLIQFSFIDKMCCASRKSVYQWAVFPVSSSCWLQHFPIAMSTGCIPVRSQYSLSTSSQSPDVYRRGKYCLLFTDISTTDFSQGACSITILRIQVSTSH